MKLCMDRRRVLTTEDRRAVALIAEGFKRLRAQQVSNASTGAPGVVDSTPITHACDPFLESSESNNG